MSTVSIEYSIAVTKIICLTSLNVYNKIGEEVLEVLTYPFTNGIAAFSKFRS